MHIDIDLADQVIPKHNFAGRGIFQIRIVKIEAAGALNLPVERIRLHGLGCV